MKNISESNHNNKVPLSKGHSLYVRILTAFLALISLTVLPIIIYGYFVDSYIMLTMADNLIDQVTKTAIEKSIDYLMPLSRIVEISSKMTEIGAISSTDNSRLEKYALQILQYYPHTSMFYLGDENGNFLMARRLQDGTIATNLVNRKTSPPTEIWKYRDASFNVVRTVNSLEDIIGSCLSKLKGEWGLRPQVRRIWGIIKVSSPFAGAGSTGLRPPGSLRSE